MMNHKVLSALVVVAAFGCGEVTGVSPDADIGNPNPDPRLMSVSPDSGPLGGGTEVTISGADFTDATAVVIGQLAGLNVQVSGADSITFETPAGLAPGPVDILVFNDNGFTVLSSAFTYGLAASVSAVDPASLPAASGGTVTISGTGFEQVGTPEIMFGSVAATNVTVVDDNTITAMVPAVAADQAFIRRDVVVGSANGTVVVQDGFFYTAPGLLVVKLPEFLEDTIVYWIDPSTAEARVVSRPIYAPMRMTPGPDGWMYAASSGRGMGLAYSTFRFDPLTTEVEFFESGCCDKRARAFAAVGGNVYMVNRDSNRLEQMDATTGARTPVSAAGQSLGRAGCMVLDAGNNLHWLDRMSETLDSIDYTTGVLTAGTLSPGLPTEHWCHGAARIGSTIYVSTIDRNNRSTAELWTLNPATAEVTKVGNLPPRTRALSNTPPGW